MKILSLLTLFFLLTACGKENVTVHQDNTPPDRSLKYIYNALSAIPIGTTYAGLPDDVIDIINRYGTAGMGGDPKIITFTMGDILNGTCNDTKLDLALTFTKGALTEAKDSCK